MILTDNAQNRNPNNFKFGVGGLVPVYLNDTKEEYEHYLTSIGMHGATTNHWTDITGLVVTPKNNIVIIHTMSSEIENARQAIRLFILKNYGQDALKDSISENSPFYTKNEKDKELKLYPVSYNSLTDFLNKLAPWKKDIHGNDIIDDPKIEARRNDLLHQLSQMGCKPGKDRTYTYKSEQAVLNRIFKNGYNPKNNATYLKEYQQAKANQELKTFKPFRAAIFDAGSAASTYIKINGKEVLKYNGFALRPTTSNNFIVVEP